MATLLRMPEISANATEAVLQEWSVAENTPFVAEDILATIETDKAAVDIEAENDGVIIKMLVSAGAAVEVGAPIALLGDPTEIIADLDALLAELGVASAGPARIAERREVPDPPPGTPANGGRVFVSPLARRLAKDAGLTVDDIPGTGPGGRVTRDDVVAVLAQRATNGAAAAAPPPAAAAPVATPQPIPESPMHAVATPTPAAATPAMTTTAAAAAPATAAPATAVTEKAAAATAATGGAGYTDVPHSRIRKAVAQRLTESKQTIPHFYLQGSAQVDDLLQLRAKLNASGTVKISVNDLLIKAAARAHTLVPAMNVIWTSEAVRQFDSVDMSVAIASDRGLVTPVLRSVEQLSVGAVAAAVRDFVGRAQTGRLRQNELEGGAFSITNLGMFGVEDFSAIINPPQSAILAVGAARPEPVVQHGELAVGSVVRFTLSVDHRAIDGALAAEWLRAFVAVLTDPIQILL